MPRQSANAGGKKGGGTAARAAGGFAPLALALLVGNALLPSANKSEIVQNANASAAAVCADDLTDYRDCHEAYPTGCSKAGKYDAYLNLLKNSLAPAATGGIRYLARQDFADLDSHTPSGLTPGNHAQYKDQLAALGEGHVFGVVAYLYYAQATGAESSNCQMTGPDDVDYHIGIGFDPAVAATATQTRLSAAAKKKLTQNSVIVEMTPHYRGYLQPNWSLDELKRVLGQKVRVEGQLMIDNEHYVAAQDCAMPGTDSNRCWRASAWELHPVTRFQVCNGNVCDQNSSDWVELEQAQGSAGSSVATAPARRSNPNPSPN